MKRRSNKVNENLTETRFIDIPLSLPKEGLRYEILLKLSDIQCLSALRSDTYVINCEGAKTTYKMFAFEIYAFGMVHKAFFREEDWDAADNPDLSFEDYVRRLHAAIGYEWTEDNEVIALADPYVFIEE